MLQASAVQSFADGLSCVSITSVTYALMLTDSKLFAFFAHTSILPTPYSDFPYSNPSLRYALRMRPFLGLSIPEVPTYPEFAHLASLPTPDSKAQPKSKSSTSTKPTPEVLALLDSAVEALKNARKEWEAISKASPSMARTTSCEEWWRADVKNVLRACIMANIAVGTVKKAVAGLGKGRRVRDVLEVDVSTGAGEGEKGKGGYHVFWIVPKVTAL